MTNKLEELQAENTTLKKTIQELEQTSKMLMRRDIDLRQAYEELKQLDKEKSEFVSIAAHQLRTPLTSVRFANQILGEAILDKLDETQKRILDQAKQGIDRMFLMIEDLLTVDALDYGSLEFSLETVKIESIIDSIMTEFAVVIKHKALLVEKYFSDNNTLISVDAARLKDVISNVIDNAIKYTPVGGTVTIITEYTATGVSISVNDNGIGVEKEDISNLFKKFSRNENARLVDANGSGLGLYISKKIVEKHRGDISFVPSMGGGATFIIKLPYN